MKPYASFSIGSLLAILLLAGGCPTTTETGLTPADTTARDGGGDTSTDAGELRDADATGPRDADTTTVDASPVECGSKTCAADEYCKVRKCCGADPGFNDAGEWQGSDSYRCVPVPDGCSATNPCACNRDWCGAYMMPECEDRTVICPSI